MSKSKKSTSTQTATSAAGTQTSPFLNEELMMEEEAALPPIPDWPSIWTTPSKDQLK